MDRFKGCLLGGAIGDALGAPVEFMPINLIQNYYGLNGITDYVEYPDGTGEFTDDTQMTLFTAEAVLRFYQRTIVDRSDLSLRAITIHSHIRWLLTQGEVPVEIPESEERPIESGWLIKRSELFRRRAPGNTCLESIRNGQRGSIGNPVNNSKGCGAIMRMAPVGLMFSPTEAFSNGCEMAVLTHSHPTGYLTAGYFAALISFINNGCSLIDAINAAIHILKEQPNFAETLVAIEKSIQLYENTKSITDPKTRCSPEHIESLGGGWIAEEALAISLFCSLHYESDIRNGLLAAVNHSGDSDSTGGYSGDVDPLVRSY
jgi:ADP-ribosylglycohydrolase